MRKQKKRGRAFEEVVAEVVQCIDPHATVRQGDWIDGPDGRRDRDVFISATKNGRTYTALIECKDYNPRSGPVGISIIDAFDSKRHDLGIDIAIVCSNSGFTEPASRKAKRVGIVLIGVFRQSDYRISYRLIDYMYFRRLKIEHFGFRLEHGENKAKVECNDVAATFDGRPVTNWVCQRAHSIIMHNPIGAGKYIETLRFKHPAEFVTSTHEIFIATQMFVEIILSGGWFEQKAEIDGSAGVYDFLRRRVRMPSGPSQFRVGGMDFTAGKPIDYPPSAELDASGDIGYGEVWPQFIYIVDSNCNEPVPQLDDIIVEQDIEPIVTGLPPELQRVASYFVRRGQTDFYVSRDPIMGPDHGITFNLQGRDGKNE